MEYGRISTDKRVKNLFLGSFKFMGRKNILKFLNPKYQKSQNLLPFSGGDHKMPHMGFYRENRDGYRRR